MRVAVVHSFYSGSEPSGENIAVMDQLRILQDFGHEVALFAARTDSLQSSSTYLMRSAWRTVTTLGKSPLAEITKYDPDIIHVHNLFPNYGSNWLRNVGKPVVATIHNYRAMCANGLLFRNGQVCTDCLTSGSYSAIRHKCYRNSRVATTPLAVRSALGPVRNPILSTAHRLIFLNSTAEAVYREYGVPSERTCIVPNGIFSRAQADVNALPGKGWVYAGRVSEEKGLVQLLDQWPSDEELHVFGDGPLRSALQSAHRSVRFHGSVPRASLRQRLSEFQGLVFPSTCLENQPTVIVEALEAGVPVVALKGSAGGDLVEVHGGGVVYENGFLSEALLCVSRDRTRISSRARQVFTEKYSASAWASAINNVYTAVLNGK